ncbi:MAG TPA: hypothetical protein VK849_13415 [Longimicrobiales bacterium]|nr:hypothetical protein [Longimicrobiales bacterium]
MRAGGWCAVATACVALGGAASATGAQELADFDYENLSFRGLGLEVGYLFPTRVEPTQSIGIRMDLGYLGPGLRIVPGLSYWSSRFEAGEVRELEERVGELVAAQTGEPPPVVDLGVIDWRDVVLSLDGHVVWQIPAVGMLTFAGAGISAHMLNGDGDAINGTFVEDLLDSVSAGFNLHAGVEYPTEWFRPYLTGRYEVHGDLQYFEIRVGGQVMFGASAPGEARRP